MTHPAAPFVPGGRRQRILLPHGGARRPGLAQIDQPRAAGLVPGRGGAHQAIGHRELIHRQLGVLLGVVLADRCFAGLDVDDHQPAGGVALQPVHPAAQVNRSAVIGGRAEGSVDVDLDADLGQFASGLGPPFDERLDHRAVPGQLVGRMPLRVEGQMRPGPL